MEIGYFTPGRGTYMLLKMMWNKLFKKHNNEVTNEIYCKKRK